MPRFKEENYCRNLFRWRSFILTLMPCSWNQERIFNLKTNESVTVYSSHIRSKCISSMNLLVIWNTYAHIRKLNMCLALPLTRTAFGKAFGKAFSFASVSRFMCCFLGESGCCCDCVAFILCLASGSKAFSLASTNEWFNSIQFNPMCEWVL